LFFRLPIENNLLFKFDPFLTKNQGAVSNYKKISRRRGRKKFPFAPHPKRIFCTRADFSDFVSARPASWRGGKF